MALLRKLDNAAWWDSDEECHSVRADAYKNVRTDRDELSIYRTADDGTMLDIAVALAVTKQKLAEVDFCVFDDEFPERLGITTSLTPGLTPITAINSLHVDFKDLTAEHLYNFVCSAVREGRLVRFDLPTLRRRIQELGAENIDVASIRDEKAKVWVQAILQPT